MNEVGRVVDVSPLDSSTLLSGFERALCNKLAEVKHRDIQHSSRDFKDALNEQLYNICMNRTEERSIHGAERDESANGDGADSTGDSSDSTDKHSAADYDSELIELTAEYIDDLKKNSEYPITIENDNEKYEKISPEENAKMREEFTDLKESLIKEWEKKNGKEWPKYEDDVYDEKTGKLIRRAGDRYDAHHIHPLTLGGKNEATNITPMHVNKHSDHRGIHAPDSPYGKLDKYCKEDTQ